MGETEPKQMETQIDSCSEDGTERSTLESGATSQENTSISPKINTPAQRDRFLETKGRLELDSGKVVNDSQVLLEMMREDWELDKDHY